MHRAGFEGGNHRLAFSQGHLAQGGAGDQGHQGESAIQEDASQGSLGDDAADDALEAVASAGLGEAILRKEGDIFGAQAKEHLPPGNRITNSLQQQTFGLHHKVTIA